MTAYRVGRTYGVHVYQGDRPVATFFDADEAAVFVAAANGANYADVTQVALGATDVLPGAPRRHRAADKGGSAGSVGGL